MAAGCAVAAAKRGGIPEMIVNKRNGLLFNPMRSTCIASSISQFIQNPEFRFSLASQARYDLKKNIQNDNDHIYSEMYNLKK
jgi:glycosyltransferase involved in cell wall biosynthesis